MWSTAVYPWPELEERLAACSAPFSLDVVRHGQTEANAARRFSGSSDVPLTEQGERQARELGSRLSGRYDLAFHSPLSRSRRTLELAFAASEATARELVEDPRLAERSLGVLEGRHSMPIPEYEAGDFSYAPEGGEPYTSVTRRVLSFVADLGSVADRAGEPLRALACTHVGPMRVLVPVLRGAVERDGVLTAKYANAEVATFNLSRLTVPEFMREALHD
jgi:broad specificity phosphatase PhoE